MANKKKGKNSGKKVVVLRDELNITGGGLYCLMPYETLDKKGKAIFKIGLAIDFDKRMDQYHTYFPLGVYYEAFLVNPKVKNIKTRTMTKLETTTIKYKEIEKFIIDDIVAQKGSQRISSTTRIKHRNEDEEGATEWIYTDETTIHEAFLKAEKKYGGKTHLFYLDGLNPETGKLQTINDTAKERAKDNPLYTGKIIFHK
jgi:hypothetical protein